MKIPNNITLKNYCATKIYQNRISSTFYFWFKTRNILIYIKLDNAHAWKHKKYGTVLLSESVYLLVHLTCKMNRPALGNLMQTLDGKLEMVLEQSLHVPNKQGQFMLSDWDWPVVWSLPGPVSHDDVPPLSLVQSKISSVSCVQVHKSFSKLHLSLYVAQVAGNSSLSSPQSSEKSQTLEVNFSFVKAAFNVYVVLQSQLYSLFACCGMYKIIWCMFFIMARWQKYGQRGSNRYLPDYD